MNQEEYNQIINEILEDHTLEVHEKLIKALEVAQTIKIKDKKYGKSIRNSP